MSRLWSLSDAYKKQRQGQARQHCLPCHLVQVKTELPTLAPFQLSLFVLPVSLGMVCSLLLRRECCLFSNGEYRESGAAGAGALDRGRHPRSTWGMPWRSSEYIRQAVEFLVRNLRRTFPPGLDGATLLMPKALRWPSPGAHAPSKGALSLR